MADPNVSIKIDADPDGAIRGLVAVGRSADKLAVSLSNVGKTAQNLKTSLGGIGGGGGGFGDFFTSADFGNFDRMGRSAESAGKKIVDTSMKMQSALYDLSVTLGALTTALVLPLKGVLALTSEMEQNKIALTTMLGSYESAVNAIKDYQSFALFTPFNSKEVIQYAKSLIAVGVESKNVTSILYQLGNAASGLGLHWMPNLVSVFGQIHSAGRLMGNDLKQLTTYGLPIIEQVAKNLGIASSEFRKFSSEGEISAAQFDKALLQLTTGTGRFANLVVNQSRSLAGEWSNITEKVQLFSMRLGNEFVPALHMVNAIMFDMVSNLQSLSPKTLKWIGIVAAGTVIVLGIATALSLTTLAVIKLAEGIKVLSGVMTILANNPIVRTITLIGVAIAVLTALIHKLGLDWEYVFDRLIDKTKFAVREIKSIIQLAADQANAIMYGTSLTKPLEDFKERQKLITAQTEEDTKKSKENLAQRKKQNKENDAYLKNLLERTQNYGNELDSIIEKEGEIGHKKKGKKGKFEWDRQYEVSGFMETGAWLEYQKANKDGLGMQKEFQLQFLGNEQDFHLQFVEENEIFLKSIEKSASLVFGGREPERIAARIGKSIKGIKLFGKTLEDLKITEKSEESQAADSLKAWNESFDKRYDVAKTFFSDMQGESKKFFTNFLLGSSEKGKEVKGLFENIGKGLGGIFDPEKKNAAIGGIFGDLMGALAGPVSVGIGQIISGIFGGTGKTVAEYAQEAFDKMVKNTNDALDKIGKPLELIEKQISALEALAKTQPGGLGAVMTPEMQKKIFGEIPRTGMQGDITFRQMLDYLREDTISKLKTETDIRAKEYSQALALSGAATGIERYRQTVDKYGAAAAMNSPDAQKRMNEAIVNMRTAVSLLNNVDIDPDTVELFRAFSRDLGFAGPSLEQMTDLVGKIEAVKKLVIETEEANSMYQLKYLDNLTQQANIQEQILTSSNEKLEVDKTAADDARRLASLSGGNTLMSALTTVKTAIDQAKMGAPGGQANLDAATSALRSAWGASTVGTSAKTGQAFTDLLSTKKGNFGQFQQTFSRVFEAVQTFIANISKGTDIPQLATGLDGSQLEPFMARFSPGEIVIPQEFSRLLKSGQLQLSNPNTSGNGPSTVNIVINGTDKSGSQMANEILPYLKPYLDGQLIRSNRGNSIQRF